MNKLNLNNDVFNTMVFQGIRLHTKNGSYWINEKNGFNINDSNFYDNNIVIYTEVKNKKIVAFLEVLECNVLRTEKIISKYGNTKNLKKYYCI